MPSINRTEVALLGDEREAEDGVQHLVRVQCLQDDVTAVKYNLS